MPPKKMKNAMAKVPAKPRNKTPMRSAMKAAPVVSTSKVPSRKDVVKKDVDFVSLPEPDVLESLIQRMTAPGLIVLIATAVLVACEIFGEPHNLSLHICALVLGMGRGGVPGCATVAAAFFVLLAKDGQVKQV